MICRCKNVDNVLLRIMIIIIMIKSEYSYIFMWKSKDFYSLSFTNVVVRGDTADHYCGLSKTIYIFEKVMTHRQRLPVHH